MLHPFTLTHMLQEFAVGSDNWLPWDLSQLAYSQFVQGGYDKAWTCGHETSSMAICTWQHHKADSNPEVRLVRRKARHIIAARVLATYLIPGCVGRGVRLGSENSSGGGAGGVWAQARAQAWAQAWAQAQARAQARAQAGSLKNPKHRNSQNQNPFCPKCRQGLD